MRGRFEPWKLKEEHYRRRNFENLIWIYREELLEILNGRSVNVVFPQRRLRSILSKRGVLKLVRDKNGVRYELTPQTIKLLEELRRIEEEMKVE